MFPIIGPIIPSPPRFLLMPHPLFEIDELIRPIIDDLVEISPRTAVSLALTCRSLEEPTLSSLWKRQPSLDVLLMVLPGCTLPKPMHGLDGVVSGRDSPAYLFFIDSLRQLNTILRQRSGPGYNDTLPGCVSCTLTSTESLSVIPSPGSQAIYRVGFCFPSWSDCAGMSLGYTHIYPSSASSSRPISNMSTSTPSPVFRPSH